LTAVDSRPDWGRRKVVLAMQRVTPELVQAVRQGTYVVDPQLVADAMLQRHARRAEAERLAAVLEAGELGNGSVGGADDDPGALPDVA
jgi:hypothetical protein